MRFIRCMSYDLIIYSGVTFCKGRIPLAVIPFIISSHIRTAKEAFLCACIAVYIYIVNLLLNNRQLTQQQAIESLQNLLEYNSS